MHVGINTFERWNCIGWHDKVPPPLIPPPCFPLQVPLECVLWALYQCWVFPCSYSLRVEVGSTARLARSVSFTSFTSHFLFFTTFSFWLAHCPLPPSPQVATSVLSLVTSGSSWGMIVHGTGVWNHFWQTPFDNPVRNDFICSYITFWKCSLGYCFCLFCFWSILKEIYTILQSLFPARHFWS